MFYGSADPVEAELVALIFFMVTYGVVTLNIDTGQKRLELGSTTARSVDEVALIQDTIKHYAPVTLVGRLANKVVSHGRCPVPWILA